MKWLDRGQIFSTEEYGVYYAKSPQALVFKDYVRIYFSACRPDNGKLISYVCYADFACDFCSVLNVSRNVMCDGGLGCFDEHGIFPFSPVRVGDKIHAYTSGISRRLSVSVDSGIGFAVSNDNGNTFERCGSGPVITSSLLEPFLVVDGFVREYDGQLHMWYIYGTDWIRFNERDEPDRIYKITHAVSQDGLSWVKDNAQIIADKVEYEAQALPSVIKWKNLYHMMFCYRHAYDFRANRERSYKLGYAYSSDLKHWTRDDSKAFVSNKPWANEMTCYPNLFELHDRLYLLYNGNNFGKEGFGLAELIEL